MHRILNRERMANIKNLNPEFVPTKAAPVATMRICDVPGTGCLTMEFRTPIGIMTPMADADGEPIKLTDEGARLFKTYDNFKRFYP